ncbi:hypothetical protein C7271_04200 [filamentous cyanobacterium CCP5]|nr:hypothetical protein C7271_04200 [filamentous cyanobacterium CCP5]
MVSAPSAYLEVGGRSPDKVSLEQLLPEMVCRLSWPALVPYGVDAAVQAAAQQLVEIVATLRSPQAGWPDDLPLTPENLAPYVTEEATELVAALGNGSASVAPDQALIRIAQLLPRLLWAIASSSYETMRLLEGIKVRDCRGGDRFELRVVRLVPVLSFVSNGASLGLDMVTQEPPQPASWLVETAQMQLVEGDLDDQSRTVADWLALIGDRLVEVAPALAQLRRGQPVVGLLPGQDWQTGHLRLDVHLVDMGRIIPEESVGDGGSFTLDDFAELLEPEAPQKIALLSSDRESVLTPLSLATAWITFTDDGWIQRFLLNAAGHDLEVVLAQVKGAESALTAAAFTAVTHTQDSQGWLNHSFVHHSILLADLWPRLRWYVIRRHPQLMELMAGQPVRYLAPGSGWQLGQLRLQVLMTVDLGDVRWLIDLTDGSALRAPPEPLPPETVFEGMQLHPDSDLYSLEDLQAFVTGLAPIPEVLQPDIPIAVQHLDGDGGLVPGQLRLSWQFTIWPGVA